ncbi:MAG: glycosyltransferase, partial [Bacteroidota bacterium]|nr:glycosyltransferase [Bacteroidota bacterium]
TNGGGTPEIVEDGISGFLIPGNDAKMLADKINYLLKNKSISKVMGKKGQDIVLKHFTIDKMIEKTYNIYNLLTTNTYKGQNLKIK